MSLEKFLKICEGKNIELNSGKLRLLERYVNTLLEENKKVNLISRKSERDIWEKQILESVAVLKVVNLLKEAKVLDFGTGGGLPGIPLKILEKDWDLTLIDSTKKKIDAVKRIIKKIELKKVKAVWSRGEELSKNKYYKNKFDFVLARGAGKLDYIIKNSIDFLKKDGKIVVWKGGDIREELQSVKGYNKIEVLDLDVEGLVEKKVVLIGIRN